MGLVLGPEAAVVFNLQNKEVSLAASPEGHPALAFRADAVLYGVFDHRLENQPGDQAVHQLLRQVRIHRQPLAEAKKYMPFSVSRLIALT